MIGGIGGDSRLVTPAEVQWAAHLARRVRRA